MTLTTKEVEHLAKLARLELTPAEVEQYAAQLGEVLAYVAKLQTIKGQAESSNPEGVKLRADEVRVWPNAEKLIKAAPEQENNAVSVPEVFTNRE